MAVTIDWGTKVISILQSDLTPIAGSKYYLDVNWFRLQLKDLEDSELGMVFDRTHNHNTEVILSGVNYARVIEIINGYTVSFEDTGTPYSVRLQGANTNVFDVTNVTPNVSVIVTNSAGLISESSADVADAILDGENIEVGLSVREALRLITAALAGKVSGAAGTSITFRNPVADSKDRIVATVDADGNRSAIVYDLTD
jgi:hypothetical protein